MEDLAILKTILKPSEEIFRCFVDNLVGPGENYGSLMLSIKLMVREKNTKAVKIKYLVAKMLPTNLFMQKVFQSNLTFKKELEFYQTIVPTLIAFQSQYGVKKVDFVPKFYGGNLSDDSIIVLENIKKLGYDLEERSVGFNLATTKLILEKLAEFHALPIALKLLETENFRRNVLPFLETATFFTGLGYNAVKTIIEDAINIIQEDNECGQFSQCLRKIFEQGMQYLRECPLPNEPFATMAHCDLWVNNVMLKFTKDEIKCKFLDFQMTEYNSPAKDLIFFLFISVQNDIIQHHYEELLKFYHRNLLKYLEQFQIDTKEFSFEQFQEEIETVVRQNTLLQCFVMVRTVFEPKGQAIKFDQLENEKKMKEATKTQREKFYFLVREFSKRGWMSK